MLNAEQRQQLHDIARNSIINGLQTGEALAIDPADYDAVLQQKAATFVTLHKHKQLRGCIGILEPLRPLANDVAQNAFSAAFSDHRFPPVSEDEIDQLDLHISILSPPTPVNFTSEDDLVSQLRPDHDGLIMQEGSHRGTFLPSVWETIKDKHEFVNHLKQKSGLPENYWSDTISVLRYTVEEF